MTGLWAAVNDTIQRTTGEISVGRKGYFLTPHPPPMAID
jgi:hypothetical protein